MKTNGFPKYIISHNGCEFKNKILRDYCIENNILFVHGLQNLPHS